MHWLSENSLTVPPTQLPLTENSQGEHQAEGSSPPTYGWVNTLPAGQSVGGPAMHTRNGVGRVKLHSSPTHPAA
jgi:hypothetical protein